MIARARAGATLQKQQRQEWGQHSDDSCKDGSKGDAVREGNAVKTTGNCGNGGGKFGSNGGGKAADFATTVTMISSHHHHFALSCRVSVAIMLTVVSGQ